MAKNAGLTKYSRTKKDQLLELIETKTEHTFERIPKPATKKEIMIKAKQHGLKGVGRYWTSEKLGIENNESEIRHTLCSDIMYDIDTKNAHPTLLSCFCHENGIECKGLDAYIEHREEYLAILMKHTGKTRDECKQDTLAIINGRRVIQIKDDPEWYKSYCNGMKHITESIIALRPDLHKLAKQSKEKNENRALMIAFDYLTKQNIKVGALVFDGLMVYQKDVPKEMLPELLEKCSAEVKKVMGCDITFTNKVMDEGYGIPLDASSTQPVNVELLLRTESDTTLQQELEKKVNKIKTSTQQKIDVLVDRMLAMEEQTKENLNGIRMFMQLKHPAGRLNHKTVSGSVSGKDIAQMFKPSPP
ncbi:unnamed protein product [Mytilus coruscus]|uniref:Uncharacterized protein n=1 Tax=Mytilus coruscus TaxID=42192 RepID=A0A6J8DU37_MYTCO|nr:unnamed protein product [Mytilus coruscus]